MIKGRDFIFTGLQPWDIPIGSNARDIALEVSLNNRVLYVNTPLRAWSKDLKSTSKELLHRQNAVKKGESIIRKISDNLSVLDIPFTLLPVNILPKGILFDLINYQNNNKIFNAIRASIQRIGFKDVIHFIDNDIYRSFYSKDILKPSLSVYYLRDNIKEIDYWRKHACRLEPKLIKKSDLVVCNSSYLAAGAKRFNSNCFDVGQGVDLTAYKKDSYHLPDDMRAISHPIVGYVGHITSLRLDADLIHGMAESNPTVSFVMVGSMDEVFDNHAVKGLANVHFLGFRSPDLVATYINSFDICMNPQLVNGLTIGNYPRKIDEYLALGKPVLATKTDTMGMFSEYVHLCSSVDEYNSAIKKIVNDGYEKGRDERITFANKHTWENSVGAIYDAIIATETKI